MLLIRESVNVALGFCVAVRLFPTEDGPLAQSRAPTIRWNLDNVSVNTGRQFVLAVTSFEAVANSSLRVARKKCCYTIKLLHRAVPHARERPQSRTSIEER